MIRTVNSVISIIITFLKLLILKLLYGNSLKFGLIERFSPNVKVYIRGNGCVQFGSKVRIHSGGVINANNGRIFLNKNVAINYNCIIACHENIEIGENTIIGPNVCIYDHDHDFRANLVNDKFKSSPVKIGKNCWIGANTVILRGTTIGDNCVVAAGSVIKGNYSDNNLLYSKNEIKCKAIEYSRE